MGLTKEAGQIFRSVSNNRGAEIYLPISEGAGVKANGEDASQQLRGASRLEPGTSLDGNQNRWPLRRITTLYWEAEAVLRKLHVPRHW
jgi:hypothetical protein